MESTGMISLSVFILCAALILWMLVSLFRTGDERRQHIVNRSCVFTLCGMTGYLLGCILGRTTSLDPFRELTFVAVLFAIALVWNKRQFGG